MIFFFFDSKQFVQFGCFRHHSIWGKLSSLTKTVTLTWCMPMCVLLRLVFVLTETICCDVGEGRKREYVYTIDATNCTRCCITVWAAAVPWVFENCCVASKRRMKVFSLYNVSTLALQHLLLTFHEWLDLDTRRTQQLHLAASGYSSVPSNCVSIVMERKAGRITNILSSTTQTLFLSLSKNLLLKRRPDPIIACKMFV